MRHKLCGSLLQAVKVISLDQGSIADLSHSTVVLCI